VGRHAALFAYGVALLDNALSSRSRARVSRRGGASSCWSSRPSRSCGGTGSPANPSRLLRRPAPAGSGLATAVVGSYPQPRWLVDPATLLSSGVPRCACPKCGASPTRSWEAQDGRRGLAVQDMERAGVDIVSDGEQRREATQPVRTALGGVDLDRPGMAMSRTGKPTRVPAWSAPIVRGAPCTCARPFLRDLTGGKSR